MVDWKKKLDALYPKLSQNARCALCGKKAEHQHHIIPRANDLLRYDVKNLLPLCHDCHSLVHDKNLNLSFFIPTARWLYLEQMSRIQFQDYLLGHGLTRDEFFKQKEKELKEIINARK